MKAGEERDFIRSQRNTVAELYEQLKVQKKRKQDLEDRVSAYRMVKAELHGGQQGITLDKKLEKLLFRLNKEKAQM